MQGAETPGAKGSAAEGQRVFRGACTWAAGQYPADCHPARGGVLSDGQGFACHEQCLLCS